MTIVIHSFLLIGQSNAAGRGFIHEAPPIDTCGGRIKVQRNGRWLEMFRPVNPDRGFSGVCLAESFAKAYCEEHNDVEVGIIPCADGGTSLEQWKPGSLLFDNAVNCAKLAMRTSHLVGVLWHQGEGDCIPESYSTYCERFHEMMLCLRQELGIPDLPILLGGLGDYLADCSFSQNMKNYSFVNEQLKKIVLENSNCAYVSAEGLGPNPDNLHFSAQALNEFGIRYYEAFKQMNVTDIDSVDCNKEKISELTEMEKL